MTLLYEETYRGFKIKIHSGFSDMGLTPWLDWTCCDDTFDGEWTTKQKAPHEVIIAEDRGMRMLYDRQYAVQKLKKQVGGQEADRIVNDEIQSLQDFCKDEWWYVDLSVEVNGEIVDSICGYQDGFGDYALTENDYEFLICEAKKSLDEKIDNFAPSASDNFYPLVTA